MTGHKAIRKEVLRNIILTKRDFEIEVEMTAKFLLSKYKILEKPIVYMPRKMGKSKMKLRHGLTSLVTLFTEKLKWIIK